MNILAIILIALSLSTDTFAVALAKNANSRSNNGHIITQGLMFGLAEMSMFLFGWLIASRYSNLISNFDHWLAFLILSAVGTHMIYAAINENMEKLEVVASVTSKKSHYLLFILTVIGTSIDAAAVGVTFAVIDVDIVFAAIVIGISSFFMTILAVILSRKTGVLLGQYAEMLGGSVLILIGFFILYSHL